MALATEILLLVLGTLFGAWIQSKRERMNGLRENIFKTMGDEITHAKYSGNIDQENGLSTWTDVDRITKRQLPSPLRKEFAAYFQRSADLKDQKEILEELKSKMGPQYAQASELFKYTDGELKVVSSHDLISQDIGYRSSYNIELEEWLLEYGPVISELFDSGTQGATVSAEDIEKAIHEHSAENKDLENISEVWDQVAGEGQWGNIIKNMFLVGLAGRYLLHLRLLENAKSDIKDSAKELDQWLDILATTSFSIPYWMKIKKRFK